MSTRPSGAGRGKRPAPAAPRVVAGSRGVAPVIGMIAALTLVAGYAFVSIAFTTPPNPVRSAVRDGFAPYFSQQWDVFAPNLLRVNSAMQVQVQWRDDNGELAASEWVDVTHTELAASRGVPMPSRISKSSVNAIGEYVSRYDELDEAQQERVTDTFITVDDGEFAPIPDEELVAELADLGDDDSGVGSFLRYDYMLVRFAAAFGDAYFGRDVERVRWRVQFDRPNDFLHRFDDERQTELNYLTFGWRQVSDATSSVPDEQTVAVFRDVVGRYAGEDRS